MKKTYLTGGAIRDKLMKRPCNDYDWVVVGSTDEDMLKDGFTQVGADFPVYLHPSSGHEYALARRERKTGNGYTGFECDFGTDVSIEEDLQRRDLTINSIAIGPIEDPQNMTTIDPYGGEYDIKNKILRHTSDAFSEDPVRVLRVARFRARFGKEWRVASETQSLISQMAKKGVLSELTSERVWKELSRALLEPYPRLFFDTLLECDALHVIFPEVYRLKTALESHRWHPEGDAYEHTMLVLTQAARWSGDDEFVLTLRMCALTHDFGKGITPRDKLPKHHGHDVKGVAIVEEFCNRNSVPTKVRDRCMKVCRYHMYMHKLLELNSKTIVKMFDDMGSLNDPRTVEFLHWLGVCDANGRKGYENESYLDEKNVLFDYWAAYQGVKFADVFPDGETSGEKIKQHMFKARIGAVNIVKCGAKSND